LDSGVATYHALLRAAKATATIRKKVVSDDAENVFPAAVLLVFERRTQSRKDPNNNDSFSNQNQIAPWCRLRENMLSTEE
jgi:hypothetical protein